MILSVDKFFRYRRNVSRVLTDVNGVKHLSAKHMIVLQKTTTQIEKINFFLQVQKHYIQELKFLSIFHQ
jgi:hypothetical protein